MEILDGDSKSRLGREGDLTPFEFVEDKNVRLELFNSFLRERKLKSLEGVGDYEDPEIGTELTDIRSSYEVPKRFFTVVTFGAKFWGGVEGEYSLIFKANGEVADGSVFVTEIEGDDGEKMFVLLDQYRISHNKNLVEIPRGFAELDDGQSGDEGDVKLSDFGSVKLFRELYEETGIEEIRDFKFLGKVVEDSSTSPSDANVFFVKAKMPTGQWRKLDVSESSSRLVFKSSDELFSMIKEGGIRDMHSLSAILKAISSDGELGDEYAEFLLTDGEDFEEPENTMVGVQKTLKEVLPGFLIDYHPGVIDMMPEGFNIFVEPKDIGGVMGWWNKTFPDSVGDVYFERDNSDRRLINGLKVYLDRTRYIQGMKSALKVVKSKYPDFPEMKIEIR
jgi:hypothetical protein